MLFTDIGNKGEGGASAGHLGMLSLRCSRCPDGGQAGGVWRRREISMARRQSKGCTSSLSPWE